MIDFELSEEQQMIRETVGAFAIEQMRPAARAAMTKPERCPPSLIEKLWELGVVVQSAIPEKFGGAGDTRSAVTGAVIAEELGYGDIAIATHAMAPRLFAFPILEMGTDGQRERYLKQFAAPSKFVAGHGRADGAAVRFRSYRAGHHGSSRRLRLDPQRAQMLRAARGGVRV